LVYRTETQWDEVHDCEREVTPEHE